MGEFGKFMLANMDPCFLIAFLLFNFDFLRGGVEDGSAGKTSESEAEDVSDIVLGSDVVASSREGL